MSKEFKIKGGACSLYMVVTYILGWVTMTDRGVFGILRADSMPPMSSTEQAGLWLLSPGIAIAAILYWSVVAPLYWLLTFIGELLFS